MDSINNEQLEILFSAIVKKFGPFDLVEEDIVENTAGFSVVMDELGTLRVETWNADESKN